MNILAFDSSSAPASCALLKDDFLVGEFMIHTPTTHSQTLLPMVDNLLTQCQMSLDDVDLFAVTAGPGSFTGVRIGISTVKGLAFANNKPCASVSTLHSLAVNLSAFRGYIVPLMDARREQVYTAIFHAKNMVVTRVSEDAAMSIQELAALLANTAKGEPIVLVGDGALLHFPFLSQQIADVALAPEAIRYQRASSVGAIALQMAQDQTLLTAKELEPFYLRLPQAERERLDKTNQKEAL